MVFFSSFSEEAGSTHKLFYFTMMLVVIVYTAVALAAPLITPECHLPPSDGPIRRALGQGTEGGKEDAPNPSYRKDACRWVRYPVLLGLNKWEADMCLRVIVSIIMGSIIGFERRRADRPAGIRTMAMVCLGACVFTIDSMFAFVDGTMGWDASRVSAAIPSGVGFLGAASIWKGTTQSGNAPEVHGLTTATSVWLSAAVGLLCGGGLYMPALFSTATAVVYLRFAPRLQHGEEGEDDAAGADEEEARAGLGALMQPLNPAGMAAGSPAGCGGAAAELPPGLAALQRAATVGAEAFRREAPPPGGSGSRRASLRA